jgi:hypothetical protein
VVVVVLVGAAVVVVVLVGAAVVVVTPGANVVVVVLVGARVVVVVVVVVISAGCPNNVQFPVAGDTKKLAVGGAWVVVIVGARVVVVVGPRVVVVVVVGALVVVVVVIIACTSASLSTVVVDANCAKYLAGFNTAMAICIAKGNSLLRRQLFSIGSPIPKAYTELVIAPLNTLTNISNGVRIFPCLSTGI